MLLQNLRVVKPHTQHQCSGFHKMVVKISEGILLFHQFMEKKATKEMHH